MKRAIETHESAGSLASIRLFTALSYSCPVVIQWQQHTAQHTQQSSKQPQSVARKRPTPAVGGTSGVEGASRSYCPICCCCSTLVCCRSAVLDRRFASAARAPGSKGVLWEAPQLRFRTQGSAVACAAVRMGAWCWAGVGRRSWRGARARLGTSI